MQNASIISEIFDYLKEQKLVETEHQYSEYWLGQSESYLRTLRFKSKEPSLGVVAVIGSRLRHLGEQLTNTTQHSQVGQKFIEFSEKCHQIVNKTVTGDLMSKFN